MSVFFRGHKHVLARSLSRQCGRASPLPCCTAPRWLPSWSYLCILLPPSGWRFVPLSPSSSLTVVHCPGNHTHFLDQPFAHPGAILARLTARRHRGVFFCLNSPHLCHSGPVLRDPIVFLSTHLSHAGPFISIVTHSRRLLFHAIPERERFTKGICAICSFLSIDRLFCAFAISYACLAKYMALVPSLLFVHVGDRTDK